MSLALSEPRAGPLLQVNDISVTFHANGLFRRSRPVRAVAGVSLDVRRGETVALVGESGSGKTTTGRAILRLVPLSGGSIEFDGHDLAAARRRDLPMIRRKVQMVFQDPYASLNPRLTVEQLVREPLDIHGIGSKSVRQERVATTLEQVGIEWRDRGRRPRHFSGGQRQRIAIARAIALDPQLIVADEPISALDVSIQAQILSLLEQLQRDRGIAYLLIAHDLAVVRHVSKRVAVMYLGKIVEEGPTHEVFTSARHPYTTALLSAAPVPDPDVEATRRRIILRGDVPSPANPPSGCRFHTRCWLSESLGNPERCRTEEPSLEAATEGASGHRVACHFSEATSSGAPPNAHLAP